MPITHRRGGKDIIGKTGGKKTEAKILDFRNI